MFVQIPYISLYQLALPPALAPLSPAERRIAVPSRSFVHDIPKAKSVVPGSPTCPPAPTPYPASEPSPRACDCLCDGEEDAIFIEEHFWNDWKPLPSMQNENMMVTNVLFTDEDIIDPTIQTAVHVSDSTDVNNTMAHGFSDEYLMAAVFAPLTLLLVVIMLSVKLQKLTIAEIVKRRLYLILNMEAFAKHTSLAWKLKTKLIEKQD